MTPSWWGWCWGLFRRVQLRKFWLLHNGTPRAWWVAASRCGFGLWTLYHSSARSTPDMIAGSWGHWHNSAGHNLSMELSMAGTAPGRLTLLSRCYLERWCTDVYVQLQGRWDIIAPEHWDLCGHHINTCQSMLIMFNSLILLTYLHTHA